MRSGAVLAACGLVWAIGASQASAGPAAWEEIRVGAPEPSFVAIDADAKDPKRLFAATPRGLYESLDEGATWFEWFQAPGRRRITGIALDPHQAGTVLVATDGGLYVIREEAPGIYTVQRASRAKRCFHIAHDPRRAGLAFLAADRGLALSTDHGQHWRELRVPREAKPVVHVALDPGDSDRLYLLAADALFSGEPSTGAWRRLQSAVDAADPPQEAPSDDEALEETSAGPLTFHAIAVDPDDPATLYLATSRGVRMTEDRGESWRWLPATGLVDQTILRVFASRALYAATGQGLAQHLPEEGRWEMLGSGRAAAEVSAMLRTPHALWIATREGLFRSRIDEGALVDGGQPALPATAPDFGHEPTIGEVQAAAIRYAEVDPGKITSWRKQARFRAALPKVTLTGDTNLTDFRHWDSGTNPDTLMRGERDLDWSASLTWELADLVWSADQTSIDARSKLLVELRDDIVGEVTRAYYERRRLQADLLYDPPADAKARRERELRVEELTAVIDGFTGGMFSHRVRQHPTR